MRALAVGMLVAVAFAGCKDFDPPPTPPFRVYVKVESDPSKPVEGATVARGTKTLATTDAEGRALLTIAGSEGESVDVAVKCPDQFQSPLKSTSIRLTRFADPKRVPEYAVACPPTKRRVVVAIKAENGANLPVRYLNQTIARTDASGAAHVLLEVPPGSQFQIGLDTSDNPRMKPPSPTRPFTVGQSDDILLFEQKFDVERIAPRYVAPRVRIPRAIN